MRRKQFPLEKITGMLREAEIALPQGMTVGQENIRSDNGSELTAKAVRRCLEPIGVKTAFIEPGSPWENGYRP